jgi:hypothetical protein
MYGMQWPARRPKAGPALVEVLPRGCCLGSTRDLALVLVRQDSIAKRRVRQ